MRAGCATCWEGKRSPPLPSCLGSTESFTWDTLEIKHRPGDHYGQQEGPQEVDLQTSEHVSDAGGRAGSQAGLRDGTHQGRVQDSTPEKPQVKVKPGQGAGAKGLLVTEAPAPGNRDQGTQWYYRLWWHQPWLVPHAHMCSPLQTQTPSRWRQRMKLINSKCFGPGLVFGDPNRNLWKDHTSLLRKALSIRSTHTVFLSVYPKSRCRMASLSSRKVS